MRLTPRGARASVAPLDGRTSQPCGSGGGRPDEVKVLPADRRIEDVLRRSRRRLFAHHALRWVLEAATGGAVLLALGLLALLLAAPPRPVRSLTLLLAALLGLALLVQRTLLPLLRVRGRERLALLVEHRVPSLRCWLLSALQLDAALADPQRCRGFSPELARAHIEQAARLSSAADLAPLAPARPLGRRALLLGTLCGLFGLGLVLFPRVLGGRLVELWRGEAGQPAAAEERSGVPLVGDIRLRYVYPAYSGLPPQELAGSDGSLRALRGSKVELSARALVPVSRALLVLEGGARQQIEATLDGDGTLHASLSLLQDGAYRFGLIDGSGTLHLDSRPHPISVVPDQPPQVRLLEPATDLELDELAQLDLAWEASDDFGLARVELVLQGLEGGGEPERRALPLEPAGRRQGSGQTRLALAELGMEPGDRLQLWVEATDNDTVSGAKTGASARRTVIILSAQQRHDAATAQARQVWESMIRLLGTRLELDFPKGPEGFPGKQASLQEMLAETGSLLQAAGTLLEALRKDPMAATDVYAAFTGFRDRLEGTFRTEQDRFAEVERLSTHQRLTAGHLATLAGLSGRAVAELERSILAIDKLLDRQQIEDLQALGKALLHAQDKLRELLRRYGETKDPALRREIERELRRLQAKVEELMSRLASQVKKLPFEHLNADALKDHSVQQQALAFGEQIQAMQERMDAGDVQGALDALERFAGSLQGMLAALDEDARAQEQDGMGAVRQELAAILGETQELEAAERKLEEETARIEQELDRRQREALERKLEESLARLLEKVDGVERSLAATPPAALPDQSLDSFKVAREANEGLRASLLAPDLDQALEVSRGLRSSVEETLDGLSLYLSLRQQREQEMRTAHEKLATAQRLSGEIVAELEHLLQQARQAQTEGTQEQMQRLAQRQGELAERTRRVQERLAGLEDGIPLQSQESAQGLEQAIGEMQKARGHLGGNRPREARPAESRAAEQLKKVGQQMAQVVQPRRMGEQGQAEGEGRRPDTQKVRIPTAAEHRSPKEFREELLDAMKQGSPDSYKEQLKGYYRELVR